MEAWDVEIIQQVGEDTILSLEVKSGAKRIGIDGINSWRNRLQVAVKEIPRKGAANEAIRGLFSDLLSLPLIRIKMETGHKSRHKKIRICGINRAIIVSKLKSILESALAHGISK